MGKIVYVGNNLDDRDISDAYLMKHMNRTTDVFVEWLEEAISVVESGDIEALWVGGRLRDATGLELVNRIKEVPRLSSIPVIFLSDNPEREYIEAASAVKGLTHFTKAPSDRNKAAQRLKVIIEEQSQQRNGERKTLR